VKFNTIHVTLKGLSPLLMNRLRVEDLQRKPRSALKEYNVKDDAEKSAYIAEIDGKRQLYVPGFNIYSMILQTSGRHKIGKFSAKGILAGLMKIVPEKIPLGTDKYEVDVRPAVIQKARIARARAMLSEWKLSFDIVYESETISNPYLIQNILEEAGFRTGLLDYRPQHMGPFGTFVVEKFEVEGEK